jgi:hypothetical protein
MAEPGAGMMIDSIGGLVGDAIDQVGGKVDDVRQWAGSQGPCARQQYLHEHSLTVRPNVRTLEGKIAFLETAGPNAVQAAIANRGRPSNLAPKRYTGGKRMAAFLADNVLPQPPGPVLAAILGGPIGGGLGRAAWLDWIDDHMPPGRPSGSNTGQKFMGRNGIRIYNGTFRGSEIRAGYDQWVSYEWSTVNPYGRPNWAAKLADAKARMVGLHHKEADLLAEIRRYEILCNEQRALESQQGQQLLDQDILDRRTKWLLIGVGILAATYVATEI